MTPISYVPQRDNVRDCLIAAAATALEVTYEAMADLLGYPCDGQGIPVNLPEANGISFLELTAPLLLRAGITTTILMTAQTFAALSPGSRRNLPTEADLKKLLNGRTGLISVLDQDSGNFHALAWKDGLVIDCRASDPLANQLDDITVVACAIFEPSLAIQITPPYQFAPEDCETVVAAIKARRPDPNGKQRLRAIHKFYDEEGAENDRLH